MRLSRLHRTSSTGKHTFAAAGARFQFLTKAQIAQLMYRPGNTQSTVVTDHENYDIEYVTRALITDHVENHVHWLDFVTVLEGEGTLEIGGVPTDPNYRNPSEPSATKQTGAKVYNLHPGDYLVVPAWHLAFLFGDGGTHSDLRDFQATRIALGLPLLSQGEANAIKRLKKIESNNNRVRKRRQGNMETLVEKMLTDFEKGLLSRRQLAATLTGLVASAAAMPAALAAPSLKAITLNHVTVQVPNLQRTSKFYQDFFGMKLAQQSETIHILNVGEQFFGLEQAAGPAKPEPL